jgi:hypothetical protein
MSNNFNRKKGKGLTKAMIIQKLNEMSALASAMEQALIEWETWYQLIGIQKKHLSDEEFDCYVKDGPIFSDLTGKIMESIRQSMPLFEEKEEPQGPVLFNGQGHRVHVEKVDEDAKEEKQE